MSRNGLTYSEAGKKGAAVRAVQQSQAKLLRIEEYNKNPKCCEKCNKPLSYEDKNRKRFCSQSCSASHNNQGVRRHGKGIGSCKLCGTPTKGNFCSTQCLVTMRTEEAIELSENGTKQASHLIYRKYLIKKFGARCMKCGWDKVNPKTGKVPIEMNHIDGNSENNRLSNLEIICPNCHALTPTSKGLNKGNGRHARRQRYAEGKSF